jgi:hypothetical protein
MEDRSLVRTAATLTESSLDHPAVQAAGQGNESDAVIVVAVLSAVSKQFLEEWEHSAQSL